eukprot:TRINITY_DN3189_c0_g2_i2.p1 TRINITY_DN3189_c0_g2~~TRINITY_DN3189_c0_g2_i2.p1  ORF type:complete len:1355 (+),score=327.00 TRINITY_DN3189_c0_g2_i2:287-4351(+)
MHRRALSEQAVPMRQRRWYLNLYPKADVDTQMPFSTVMTYYGLPDYAQQKDHKQLRPAKLDETNFPGLTREEERVQRVRLMNYRQLAGEKGGRGCSVAADVPLWEEVDVHGRGRYKRCWSGAQTVEYFLRNGVVPTELDPTADVGDIDPHGILDRIDAAWEIIPSFKPQATSFRQLLPPHVFAELNTRFEALSGSQIPSSGLDFYQTVKLLSKGIQSKPGTGQMTLRRASEWLADFTAALSSALPADDVFKQLAAVTRMETALDFFSSEWNPGINDEDLISEEGFTKLAAGYASEGGKGFWSAMATLPEIKPDYGLYLEARVALQESPDALLEAVSSAADAIASIGKILNKRYLRETASGVYPPRYLATDADWIKIAEGYVLKPFIEWSASGEALKGFETDGSAEWENERSELQAVLDKKIAEDIVVSDWLRWELLPQFTLPVRVYEKDDQGPVQPYAMLAARFKNLNFETVFETMAQDHAAHCRMRAALYAKPHPEKELAPFMQFTRMVINSSNIQNYNSRMSRAFYLSCNAGARYPSTGVLESRTLPPNDTAVYDMNSVIAEMFVPGRDWATPETAASAREGARKDAQAVQYLFSVKNHQKYLQGQQEALSLVRWAAEDVLEGLGHLRRKITADVSPQKATINNVTAPKDWKCGTSGVVTWEWVPEDGYKVKVASREQKEARFSRVIEEQVEAAGRLTKEQLVAEVLDTVAKYDSVQSLEATDRHEWAFTKMHHKWSRANAEAAARREVGVEDEYRVTVDLYKKRTDRLQTLTERRAAFMKYVEEAEAKPEKSEDRRLSVIISKAREWAVLQFEESIEHVTGVAEVETRMLEAIRNGEFQKMLEAGEHLDEAEVDKVGGLWDLQCDLFEKQDETCGNTLRHRARLPFRRDGAQVAAGVYKVKVTGMIDGSPSAEGWSDEITVTDDLAEKVGEYVAKGRGGKPALLGAGRELLPAGEVPDVLGFLKAGGRGLEFDLERETKIGSDTFVHTSQGTIHTPVIHLDVLMDSIRGDHHREAAELDPVVSFASRNDGMKRKIWEATNPGSLESEWAAVRQSVLTSTENDQWWGIDHELKWNDVDPGQPDPLSEHLNTKFANLYTNYTTKLATARYEGTGYISRLAVSPGIPKLRIPLTPTPIPVEEEYRFESRESRTEEGTLSVHMYIEGGKAFLRINGGMPEPVPAVDFAEENWVVKVGTTAIRLPFGIEGEHALSAISQLSKKAGVHCTITDVISPKPHHLGPVLAEAINGAHSRHATISAIYKSANAQKSASVAALPDRILHLPTVIKAWEESVADLDPPTGLEIQRRRFDSWQLNSGKGRYDHSPTKDEVWQHPIEENPNVYGFQDTSPPMQSM